MGVKQGDSGTNRNMSGSGQMGYHRFKGHIGPENYRKLQRSLKDIKKNLSVDDVLDDLISNEVLSIEDGVEIRHKGPPNHLMADALIQKIIHVGEDGFRIFVDVLQKQRYGYLIAPESAGVVQMSPTESSDNSFTSLTPASPHVSHHVHFPDQLLQQPQHLHSPPQPSDWSTKQPQASSIRTKPSELSLETVNVVDGPYLDKGEEDYDEVEDTEYSDYKVGDKTENIILNKPVPFRGNVSNFQDWYPMVSMDRRLKEYPGCHPDVDERHIKRIVRENLDKDGHYVIWYSAKRELLIVTVICNSSPKGRYHYKVKTRKSEEGSDVRYRFSSQMQTKSVTELLDYVKGEGLPPPVQKRSPVKGSNGK